MGDTLQYNVNIWGMMQLFQYNKHGVVFQI